MNFIIILFKFWFWNVKIWNQKNEYIDLKHK